jgi:hypothetical protein
VPMEWETLVCASVRCSSSSSCDCAAIMPNSFDGCERLVWCGVQSGSSTCPRACGVIHPALCLPITIEVGCVQGALVNEVLMGLVSWYPGVMTQFEHFCTTTVFALLNKYHNKICIFDDELRQRSWRASSAP